MRNSRESFMRSSRGSTRSSNRGLLWNRRKWGRKRKIGMKKNLMKMETQLRKSMMNMES